MGLCSPCLMACSRIIASEDTQLVVAFPFLEGPNVGQQLTVVPSPLGISLRDYTVIHFVLSFHE